MRTIMQRPFIALLAAGVLAMTLQSCRPLGITEPEPGSGDRVDVLRVIDGDTILIEDAAGEHRVRLIGIDTPELGRDGTPDECYAVEARTELEQLLAGRDITIRADSSQGDVDRHERLLRHVEADGESSALVLIESGAGREYTYGRPYAGQSAHRAADDAARASGAGLWTACE